MPTFKKSDNFDVCLLHIACSNVTNVKWMAELREQCLTALRT